MKRKLRVGIIGLGYWGPNLVRNFYKIPEVEVAAVADLSKERLEKIAQDYPSIKILTKKPSDIFKSKDIDAVVVATPVHTHFKLALGALAAGKHVLVEKPMTRTVSEAERLIETASKKNLILMVDHTFVYSPPVKKIKELIEKGSLGRLHYIDSTRINLGLFQSDINVIWDLAPHDFSIINYLVGRKPQSLAAYGIKHPVDTKEAVAYLTIKYPNNILAHVNVSWFSPVKLRTMLIGGNKRMVVYDHIHPSEKIKIYDHGVKISNNKADPFNPVYRAGDISIPKIESGEALAEVCRHFVESIFNKKIPLTSGVEGLGVVKLLEASDRSLESNGVEVEII